MILDGLQPWLRPHAVRLSGLFPELQITSAYRSYSEQLALYLSRFTNPFPVAPPGKSWHQYGRAWDMVGNPRVLAAAGRVWRSWGGTWSETDPIHFQA